MSQFFSYIGRLEQLVRKAIATDLGGQSVDIAGALEAIGLAMRAAHDGGNKVMFVGNGGSAGIASHMAIDYSKNGGIRAIAFNDGAALTCLANDLGYDQVFAKQIELHARKNDILVAISSSGQSQNIVNAIAAARAGECKIYTLSGFDADNPIRKLGDLNLYLSDREYGFVEIGHLTILHAVLDLEMGWSANRPLAIGQ